ncbi:MAG: hypothetical protein ACLFSB_14505, partial [Chitinispirillaceae bacterium]
AGKSKKSRDIPLFQSGNPKNRAIFHFSEPEIQNSREKRLFDRRITALWKYFFVLFRTAPVPACGLCYPQSTTSLPERRSCIGAPSTSTIFFLNHSIERILVCLREYRVGCMGRSHLRI